MMLLRLILRLILRLTFVILICKTSANVKLSSCLKYPVPSQIRKHVPSLLIGVAKQSVFSLCNVPPRVCARRLHVSEM